MDFILADELTMQQMNAEYKEKLQQKTAAFSLDERGETYEHVCHHPCNECVHALLFLYIVAILSYNNAYGTQNFDTDRGMGRLRCNQSTFGSLNNIRYNNG